MFDLCTERARQTDWAECVPAMQGRVVRMGSVTRMRSLFRRTQALARLSGSGLARMLRLHRLELRDIVDGAETE